MTGIELITKERKEQIEKHNRSVISDSFHNSRGQLRVAAVRLLGNQPSASPLNWNNGLWSRMIVKSYEERLIIAGALVAAEIDRLEETDEKIL